MTYCFRGTALLTAAAITSLALAGSGARIG